MKEQIEKMYIQALADDLPPNVFADQVLRLFAVSGSLLDDKWNEYRSITNNEDAWSFKQWLKSNC